MAGRTPTPNSLVIRPYRYLHGGCYRGITHEDIRDIVQRQFTRYQIPDKVWFLSCELAAPIPGQPSPYVVNIYIYSDIDDVNVNDNVFTIIKHQIINRLKPFWIGY